MLFKAPSDHKTAAQRSNTCTNKQQKNYLRKPLLCKSLTFAATFEDRVFWLLFVQQMARCYHICIVKWKEYNDHRHSS